MTRFLTLAALLLAGCTAAEDSPESNPQDDAEAGAEPSDDSPVEFAGSAGAYEVAGKPCLFDPAAEPELNDAERRRRDEIQSDALELEQRLRDAYGDRLAEARVDMSGAAPRYLVRLTGTEPIPPLELGGRAADVPVVVEYGAPYSLTDVDEFRSSGHTTAAQLIPQLMGVGYRADYGTGSILLDVYNPGGAPDETVLSHCKALRIAYGIPVLIRFQPNRVEEQELFG